MFETFLFRSTVAMAAIVFLAVAVHAVTIDTVPVGNLGNSNDTHGYGFVSYNYNIGKYEVTAAQYTEFLNKVAGVDTYGLYTMNMWLGDYGCRIERFDGAGTLESPYQYRVAADWADRPVTCVSWGDAARFANWLHNGQPAGVQDLTTTEGGAYYLDGASSNTDLLVINRESGWKWAIPTEDEWYKAAYHKNDGVTGNYFDYATSSDAMPSNDLIDPDTGNNATFFADGLTIGPPYYSTECGAHENSASPYGTFDQDGNVWEWTEATLRSSRITRGGSFYSMPIPLHASYRGVTTKPAVEPVTHGFRVTAIPEPSALALLGMGAVGLLAYALRKRHR